MSLAVFNPVLLLLDLGIAVQAVLDRAHWWGPPVAAAAAVAARPGADSVRARVRTLSALTRLDADLNSLTCTDTRPDTSADTCPGRPGHRSPGGC